MLHAPAAETVKPASSPKAMLPQPARLSHPHQGATRRCACGGRIGPDGECANCKARRLMRAALPAAATPAAVPPLVNQVLASPGRPLDPGTRALMESRFGHNFGGVQVHTDGRAADSARAVQAKAYTVGDHVVFGAGRYQPYTQTGRQLIAHELAHVVQQQHIGPTLQRAPLAPSTFDTSTAGMHERSARAYAEATGVQDQPGMQYTAGYAAWLAGEADKYKFLPPAVVRKNPLDLLNNGRINATTVLKINGVAQSSGASGTVTMGALIQQYKNAITPPSVTSKPDAAGVSCRFGDDFQIQSSAEITVYTAPGAQGWQKTLPPNAVLLPADQPPCAAKANVPVRFRGKPTDQEYANLIEASEREHAQALENLHNKHFVPYYHFVRSLQATGATEPDCAANLRGQINKRDDQAVLGFIFGDLAETARFDDPALGTHHSRVIPTVDANCNGITLVANQTRPQQPGLGPGNVRSVAPVSTPIVVANLAVSGNDLTHGGATLRTFGSPANANLALQAFQHYGISEVVRLGRFEFLLANGSAPSGPLAGLDKRAIDPAYYQVTFGAPAATDWSIVEVTGDQVKLIHNFGANRDEAYSALALMQRYGFNREVWIGPEANPELRFFRKD